MRFEEAVAFLKALVGRTVALTDPGGDALVDEDPGIDEEIALDVVVVVAPSAFSIILPMSSDEDEDEDEVEVEDERLVVEFDESVELVEMVELLEELELEDDSESTRQYPMRARKHPHLPDAAKASDNQLHQIITFMMP